MDNSKAFQIMVKPTGSICNMDCKYCFYLEKENLYPPKENWAMSDEILELYIKQTIEAHQIDNVNFAWQGGEPTLLGVDYFRNVVKLQKKYAGDKEISNAFQTNGILLDDDWCDFFRKNNFLIGLSIDGPEEIHNKYRVNKGGGPTFSNVMRGIDFLKKHEVLFNTLTVVQNHNSNYPLEVYNFLKEVGSGYMQFIPIVERTSLKSSDSLNLVFPKYAGDAEVTKWSVESLQYGKFLSAIFDEWVRKDVGKYFVQMFDVALEAWYGMEPSLCVFRKTCGNAMAIEHTGDIYSCDHFVYPEYKLGNIIDESLKSIVNSESQMKFGTDKLNSLPKYCRECEVRFVCNGECPKHRFIKSPDGEDGLNYLCEGYKMFFSHIDLYMKFMASELRCQRPPANVMEWAKEKK